MQYETIYYHNKLKTDDKTFILNKTALYQVQLRI